MLTDMNIIRERVNGGDGAFSIRITLVALIKGDDATRQHILENLGVEDFPLSVFGMIFEWILQSLHSKGRIEKSELYDNMRAHVSKHWLSANDPQYDDTVYSYEKVLPGYLAVLDHLYMIDNPDRSTVESAIEVLQRRRR